MELSWYTNLHPDFGTYLHDLDHALDKANLRKWFTEYDPPAKDGYLFDDHPNMKEIHKHMILLDQHSGTSYAITCRTLKKIVCLGYSTYESSLLLDRMIDTLMKSDDYELKKQGQTLKDFRDGKLSYSEMRGLCG